MWAEVSASPLLITQLVDRVGDPGAGAIATFSGVTRNNFQGKEVIKLDYEAYVPMATKKLRVGQDGAAGGTCSPGRLCRRLNVRRLNTA